MIAQPIPFVGLSREEVKNVLKEHGFPAFRAGQLWHWGYNTRLTYFPAMTTIAKDQQPKLAEIFSLARPAIARQQTSIDTTRKWLVEFSDKNRVETVFIPEEDRGALCVSSQVGCTLS